ncbi:sensor histidine kinase [Arthrobacter monumenti]
MSTILAPVDPAPLNERDDAIRSDLHPLKDEQANDRSIVHETITIFLILGLTAMILVFIPSLLWVRAQALDHALGNIAANTQRMANFTLAPFVNEDLLSGDPEAQERLDDVVNARIGEGDLMRVKIVTKEGRIVYSDENRLIGERMQLADRATALFDGASTTAVIEEPDEGENRFESDSGQLVEVYTLATSAAGVPLIFEAYYPADAALAEQGALFLRLVPGVLLALVLLQAAQLPLAIWLSRRVQGHQLVRRRLLRQSIAASDLERRRIARDLHDEVIQDLAGLSYALESVETRSPDTVRPTIVQARTILQGNIGTLRGMLTELYPADLNRMGLPKALNRLVDPLREQGVDVSLDVPESFQVDKTTEVLLYRVARETLVNTAKHAEATSVSVELRVADHTAEMRVADNGVGFDSTQEIQNGHLGLRLARDTVAEAGGTVEITSSTGEGTCVITSVPLAS